MEDQSEHYCHCTCHESYEDTSAAAHISDGTNYWCGPCWNMECEDR